ncbi:DUF4221 family protein [Algoriphagus hitonicola]|nr:DUF4221 family protein [Algoriphagus hitonicola]
MEKLRRKLVKNLRRKLNFLLTFVLFIACTNSNKLNIEELHTLEKTGEIKIKLNKKGLSISDHQIREINEDIEIIRANYGYETLSIYSLNKSKEIGIIKLDLNNLMPFFEKGGGISGFYLKGKDSLFVMNYQSDLLLIDRNTGQYLANYNLPTSNRPNDVKIDHRFPFYITNDRIIYTSSQNNFLNKIFWEYNMINKKEKNYGEYPKFYKEKKDYLAGNWYDYLSHIMINDTILIYGHPISNNLSKLNINSKEIIEVINNYPFPRESHYTENKINNLAEEELNNLISNTYNNYHYSNLLYDKKNKKYYRILKKPIEPKQFNSYPKPLKYWKNEIEIIVYDENLKIKGKTNSFPNDYQIGIYEQSEIFNIDNKIYVKKIPENDEYITYDIYTITEKY